MEAGSVEDEARAAVEYLESPEYIQRMMDQSRLTRHYMHGSQRGQMYSIKRDDYHEQLDRCHCFWGRPTHITSVPWTDEDERAFLEGRWENAGQCMRFADVDGKTWHYHQQLHTMAGGNQVIT